MTTASHTTTTPLHNRIRLAAVLLGLGVAAALMLPSAARATPSEAASAIPVTSVRQVTLLTDAGHLRSRYTVARTGRGYCWTTSLVNGRLYRCFRGNYIHDPCWKESGRRSVVCLAAPWGTRVVRIRLTKRLPARDSYGPAIWGLRLGDGIGVGCRLSQGASGAVGGKGISYFCRRGWVLLEEPDRSTPQWTIATARWVTDRYEPRGRHHLTVAWKAVVH